MWDFFFTAIKLYFRIAADSFAQSGEKGVKGQYLQDSFNQVVYIKLLFPDTNFSLFTFGDGKYQSS